MNHRFCRCISYIFNIIPHRCECVCSLFYRIECVLVPTKIYSRDRKLFTVYGKSRSRIRKNHDGTISEAFQSDFIRLLVHSCSFCVEGFFFGWFFIQSYRLSQTPWMEASKCVCNSKTNIQTDILWTIEKDDEKIVSLHQAIAFGWTVDCYAFHY